VGARSTRPTLRVEREILGSGARLLAGIDEVGRGAVGGPVSVGVVVIDAHVGRAPVGVRDSKLLSPHVREQLAPRIQKWARAYAVGHASAAEIDDIGIIAALRLAAVRALGDLPESPDRVLLDGSHDWLTASSQGSLFDEEPLPVPPVITRVKADLSCTSVAAASILAKTERDALMRGLSFEHPEYGWDVNKGYATAEHLDAIRAKGTCRHHRRSWHLP
jgi:ribonuclease HII